MDLKNTSWNGAVIDYLKIPNSQFLEDRQAIRRGRSRSKSKAEKRRGGVGKFGTAATAAESGGGFTLLRDIP